MRFFRPLPRGLSRSLSALVVLAWLGQMGLLYRSIQASTTNLASDLRRYGSSAPGRCGCTPRDKTGLLGGHSGPPPGGAPTPVGRGALIAPLRSTRSGPPHTAVQL